MDTQQSGARQKLTGPVCVQKVRAVLGSGAVSEAAAYFPLDEATL